MCICRKDGPREGIGGGGETIGDTGREDGGSGHDDDRIELGADAGKWESSFIIGSTTERLFDVDRGSTASVSSTTLAISTS